jgi:hypothetical protein
MISVYLPYMNNVMDTLEEGRNKCDERISELKREYYENTSKLPRKLKKKRRKELNEEYAFLMSIRNFDLNSYSFY